MLILEYLAVATVVVLFSIKASDYIDMLDRKTSLSGAFLGGVLLSAVTSLPELFTSISSAALIGNPGMCVGNILGSDIFNVAALCGVTLFFSSAMSRSRISRGHLRINLLVTGLYVIVLLNMVSVLDFSILSLSVTSVLIAVAYLVGIRFLSTDSSCGSDAPTGPEPEKSVRQIIVLFILMSIGIVAASIVMTYVADAMAHRYGIGAGLAGALFLGVATSLPELSSTIRLFKIGNPDIAIGNIVGSNLFNFFIISIVDVFTISSVWVFDDRSLVRLLFFGLASMLLLTVYLTQSRRRPILLTVSVAVIALYVLSLM